MSKEIINLINEYFETSEKINSLEAKSKEIYCETNNLRIRQTQLFQEIKPILLNSEGILYLEKEKILYSVIISKANNEIVLKKLLTPDEIDTKRIFNKLEGIQT